MEMDSRLEQALRDWKAREERFEMLFSPSVLKSSGFLKEKLAHFEMLQVRFGISGHADDRTALRILRQEQRTIEKRLYPNLLVRLLRRGIVAVDRMNRSKQLLEAAERSRDNVQQQMRQVGFGAYSGQIESRLRHANTAQVTFPVLWQLGEKERMDMEVKFSRQPDGHYAYDGYQAQLRTEQGKVHSFFVGKETALSTNSLHNLLSGRPVYKEGVGWEKLDLTDKDANGNYRLRHISAGSGLDLGEALKQLPLKQGQDTGQIISRLRDGDLATVTLNIKGKDQQVELQANPQQKNLLVYKDKEQVSVASLLNPGKVVNLQKEQRQHMKIAHDGSSKGVRI